MARPHPTALVVVVIVIVVGIVTVLWAHKIVMTVETRVARIIAHMVMRVIGSVIQI